jgi:hypothetical protein
MAASLGVSQGSIATIEKTLRPPTFPNHDKATLRTLETLKEVADSRSECRTVASIDRAVSHVCVAMIGQVQVL